MPDNATLFPLLVPFRLMVVHVHHGVREDAQKDADYVEELCRKWEIPFTVMSSRIFPLL